MRKVLFKDLFDFLDKSSINAGSGLSEGLYPLYTSSKIISKFFNNCQFAGEHLIFGTGGEASVHYNNDKFSVTNHCLVAKPNNQKVLFNAKYVYYYLQHNIAVLEAGFHGAGLKNISRNFIANISIPLPEFGIQNQIVTVLDTSTKILASGYKLHEHFDELITSIYFSTIKSEGLMPHLLSDLALDKKGSMRTGPFGSNLKHSEFLLNGEVRVFRLDNVVSNSFDKSSSKYITKEKFLQLKSYQVFPRDLLIALMGTGTTGKSAVVPDKIPLSINTKHLAAISLDPEKANPYYISYTIQKDDYVINQIALKNKGAVVPGINLHVVKNLKINIPSISIQNKFESFLKNIEQIKAKVSKRNQDLILLTEILKYLSFTGGLKVNIEHFSFDHQMVDFLEKEEKAKKSLPANELHIKDLKKIVYDKFTGKSFSFNQLEQALRSAGKILEYEKSHNDDLAGLKDFVFQCLTIGPNDTMPFLNQKFILDKNRDSEKNKDNSRIVFEITY